MPKYNYNIVDIDPTGLNKISSKDLEVVNTFEINSNFTPFDNNIEIHIYSLEDTLLYSDYNYTNQAYLQNSGITGNRPATELTVNPSDDIQAIGYPFGGVKVVYNFLDNLFSNSKSGGEFFIEEISSDRREIRLLTNQLTDAEVKSYADNVIAKVNSSSYYDEFYLNFKENNLLICLNLKTQQYRDYTSVIVKLYEPLPDQYDLKSVLTIVEKVSESRGFEVEAQVIPDLIKPKVLKGPNFSVEVESTPYNTTPYFNYNELFGYDTSNSYRELNALFNEKSINISIDYSDYSEFIHFSSANERLRNFKYKLDLIESHQRLIDSSSSSPGTNQPTVEYYQDQINTILKNFDHYDRHLYFESGSTSWPKLNNTKPFINATGDVTGSWYSAQLDATELFDLSNYNQLLYSIPEYLREDERNLPYATFIHMVGQHFDNLWVYTKAVTDKYDNDNRLNKGISRDLVQDALKNFGINLYNSNKSISDLFKTFTGEFYQTGEEVISTFVTSSNQAVSEDAYTNEVYKRLYHNLPLLLKSKGTERGVKALISSFGIPTDNYITGSIDTHSGLSSRIFGGNTRLADKYVGPGLSTTSSLDKVRLDDTGSIISGSTLSKDVSIVKRDDKYTIDSHPINIGYSPSDQLDSKILEVIPSSFNIDDYIGDPRLAYSSSYIPLIQSASNYVNQAMVSGSHDLQDFTRTLKFYDNVIFKMVKDFLPARSSVSTGAIIRPHVLERNKIKQVLPTVTKDIYSGSIETGFITGSDGGAYRLLSGSTPIIEAGYGGTGVKKTFRIPSSLTGTLATNLIVKLNNIPVDSSEYSVNLTNNTVTFNTAPTYLDKVTIAVLEIGSTSYMNKVMTENGPVHTTIHQREEATFNGELSGSFIQLTNGELNLDNTFKYADPNSIQYKVTTVDLSDCNLVFKAPIYDSPTCNISPTPSPTPSPSPSPSPTPSPTPTSGPGNTPNNFTAQGTFGISDYADTRYTAEIQLTGMSFSRTIEVGPDEECIGGCLSVGTISFNDNASGTLRVRKLNITSNATDGGSITIGFGLGSGNISSPSTQTFSAGQTVDYTWTLSNVSADAIITVEIFEG